jgi:hypothetical protein
MGQALQAWSAETNRETLAPVPAGHVLVQPDDPGALTKGKAHRLQLVEATVEEYLPATRSAVKRNTATVTLKSGST